MDSEPAVAEKPALVEPEATATDAGTLSAVRLLDSEMIAPPEPAACDSDTVQEETAPDPRLVGVHVNRFTTVVARTVIVPPAPVTGRVSALAEEPSAFAIPSGALDTSPGASVAFTTATTPLSITLLLNPRSTQIVAAAPEEHEMALPAAVALGPAMTVIEAIAVAEYVRVH